MDNGVLSRPKAIADGTFFLKSSAKPRIRRKNIVIEIKQKTVAISFIAGK